ncbi:hypothetical protein GTQ99_00220 [Kineococcus sp. T13]|uniref:hypothetical protein n=1 Tax=Kineococcus vitellinus TaxID=2696565 RepID=UPI0014135B80|nr:hypothetical protein [Kineococcus vitellinus]NAZ73855.1 hypothetical protein [Kineococcus vitellinus]
MKVQNPHPYPVDVPGGPVLGTAQTADVDRSDELARKIEAGALVEVPTTGKAKSKEAAK